MKNTILALGLLAVSSSAFAQTQEFKVGAGNATQQIAQVESFTDFETFTGRTDKVSGSMKFDPVKKTGSGKIIVDVKSIDTGIPLRNDHMLSAGWLDAAKFPTITFETTNVKFVKGDMYRVTGKLTLRGVTKTVTTDARVRYTKESATTKNAGFKGNVLQVRSTFNIKLADYGVKIPAQAKGKVAETVTISVTTYGQTGA